MIRRGALSKQAQYNPAAQSFITAAGITSEREKAAINFLVTSLQASGLWTKQDAIYPFVGGTEASCSYNLKNPVASAAGFQLLDNGTVTYNSTGATGDGSTGYLDTQYVIPVGKQSNFSFGVYCRNNVQGSGCAMGTCTNNGSAFSHLYLRQMGAGNAYSADVNQTNLITTFNNTNSQGFYVGSRTASNVVVAYKNGASVASDTDASVTPSLVPINILARNSSAPGPRSSFATYNIAYAFMGDGLTAPEVATYHSIVQTFQTMLGRQV